MSAASFTSCKTTYSDEFLEYVPFSSSSSFNENFSEATQWEDKEILKHL